MQFLKSYARGDLYISVRNDALRNVERVQCKICKFGQFVIQKEAVSILSHHKL